MKNLNIIITVADHAELDNVITFTGKVSERARAELHALEGELRARGDRHTRGDPSDVITLNSRAELPRSRDQDEGHAIHFCFATRCKN